MLTPPVSVMSAASAQTGVAADWLTSVILQAQHNDGHAAGELCLRGGRMYSPCSFVL